MFISNHFRGSINGKALFWNNLSKHQKMLEKNVVDLGAGKGETLQDIYSDSWAALCDKAYQDLYHLIQAIYLWKKTKQIYFTSFEKRANEKILSDRIIAENFFGRVVQL